MKKMNPIPENAYDLEVFAIKGKEAFIGFKIANGKFSFVQIPYTEPVNNEHLEHNDIIHY
jgi:hypothetical protein